MRDITVAIAVIGIAEVVGLPLILWTRLTSLRNQLHDENTLLIYGPFYSVYNLRSFYWEFILIARRFLVASIVAVAPYTNPILLIAYGAVILAYMVTQNNIRPYVRLVDNVMDSLSSVILLISLNAGLVIEMPAFNSYANVITILVIVINSSFFILSILCMVESRAHKIAYCFLLIRKMFVGRKTHLERG